MQDDRCRERNAERLIALFVKDDVDYMLVEELLQFWPPRQREGRADAPANLFTGARRGAASPSRRTILPVGSVVSIEFGYEKRAKTRLHFGELAVGMLLTGKVKFLGRRGAFVDVGVETAGGKRRDALARPGGPGHGSLTVEQADAWRGVKIGVRVLARVKSLDVGRQLAEIDIVDTGSGQAS